MGLRHLISINDLTTGEIEQLFSRAEGYLAEFGDPADRSRVSTSGRYHHGAILATLFYEPSTRTRLSFESAMLRLGGQVLSSADPAATSVAKGETLADTARIVSAYANVIVLRHPQDGAAKLASEFASVPVINGGDGAHEHPTQTLCDLFTIHREKGRIENLNVAVFGDLRGSRTVHSLVYALARFGANLLLMPARGMNLPEDVRSRLQHEFGYTPAQVAGAAGALLTAFVPPNRVGAFEHENVDVLYLTRYQKERWAGAVAEYPLVDAAYLERPQFKRAIVLHPLPRVNELDSKLDGDPRAAYFRQASYGVPVRMALISTFLNRDRRLDTPQFTDQGWTSPAAPAQCGNANCITRSEGRPRFTQSESGHWRCAYCDQVSRC